MAADLSGARVLVVGSSTGIGRCIAIEAVGAGAAVAFSARSRDKLEAAVAEAGGGVVVVGDVRDADDCTRILDETVDALGGLDLLVFATGVSPLMPMEETPAETMRDVFATNAIGGLTLLTAAAARLAEGGIIAYLGSDSVGAAYPGMVHYAASKAALDQGVDGLRMEFPETRFLRIAVGPTAGTAIALDYDPEISARMLPQMLRFARGTEKFMNASDLGELIVELLAPALRHRETEVEDIVIRPPGGPVPWGTDLGLQAEKNKAFTEPEGAGAQPMDLQFSAEDRAFATEVREWLMSRLEGAFAEVRGRGAPGREYEAVDARIAWEQELGRAGFIGMSWPKAVGGLDLSLSRQLIFWDEYVRAGGPGRIGVVGDWLLGPTLIAHGSEEQRGRFLPGILDGTVRWCQGYSEPGAGSDLAGLLTRAVLDGDEWVISGHKIWTSVADLAHWNFVLCRTGSPESRHRGISYLLVPMDQSGVAVRPIRDLTGGDTDFCEVFYDGARTDAANVVGEVDGGWQVAMSTVAFERGLSTVGYQLSFEEELRAITALAQQNGRRDDPVVRQHLAAAWTRARILRWNLLRTMSSLELGATAPVTNVYKLFWASFHQELGELALEVMGPDALVTRPGPHPFDALQTMFMYSRAETIYGGSHQIQRNIVGERALGLPREP